MAVQKRVFDRYYRPLAPLPTAVVPRLDGVRPVKAMLFDVYGTLLISSAGDIGAGPRQPESVEAMQDLMDRFGFHRPVAALSEALHAAIHREHAAARRRGIDHPEVDVLDIWRAVLGIRDRSRLEAIAIAYELITNPADRMPGLAVLLAACRERCMPMGLISNAQFYTPDLLEWFLGESLERAGFHPGLIFWSYRCGHAKPSPVMFNRAVDVLSSMGIAAETALYVGNDMRNDILPAKAAGLRTALFAGDRRSLRLRQDDDRVRDLSPDAVVTDLRQLIPGTVHP